MVNVSTKKQKKQKWFMFFTVKFICLMKILVKKCYNDACDDDNMMMM